MCQQSSVLVLASSDHILHDALWPGVEVPTEGAAKCEQEQGDAGQAIGADGPKQQDIVSRYIRVDYL